MPPPIPSFAQVLSDLTTLVRLRINLQAFNGSTDTLHTLINKKMMSLMALGVLFREDVKSGDLGILHSLTMLRAHFAKLEYPMEELDELVEIQLKAFEKPSTPSIANLTPLAMVRHLLTDSEADSYAGKLDNIIERVIKQSSDDEATVNQIR